LPGNKQTAAGVVRMRGTRDRNTISALRCEGKKAVLFLRKEPKDFYLCA
jgi:hypothetical protein